MHHVFRRDRVVTKNAAIGLVSVIARYLNNNRIGVLYIQRRAFCKPPSLQTISANHKSANQIHKPSPQTKLAKVRKPSLQIKSANQVRPPGPQTKSTNQVSKPSPHTRSANQVYKSSQQTKSAHQVRKPSVQTTSLHQLVTLKQFQFFYKIMISTA